MDYTQADQFGEVEFLSDADITPFAMSRRNEVVLSGMRKGLSDYVPGTDFLVLTGSPLNILAAGAMISKIGSKHNVLKWDRMNNRYVPVTIEL